MLMSECRRRTIRSTRFGHRAVFIRVCAGVLFLITTFGIAQAGEKEHPKVEVAVPFEFDFDFGATNGDAIINRWMPLVGFTIGGQWRLVNIAILALADVTGGVPGRPGNPEPVQGSSVFGLTDLTVASFLTPPAKSENLVWGFGPALTIPTATADQLGSGKWLLGAAIRFAYRPGQWNLGALMANQWSVSGDTDRADVNQLLIRGLIRRRLGGGWYFAYNPIITANWNAASGQKWLIPLGGGIGKTFKIGSTQNAMSVQAYANVVKPDGAPDWLVRVAFVLPIPASLRR